MGLPPVGLKGNKPAKKEKKSAVFNGKIGKNKEKFNKKAFKGLEKVKSKEKFNKKSLEGLDEIKSILNKDKKKQGKIMKDEPAAPVQTSEKKAKKVKSQTPKSQSKSNNEGSTPKLEKKNKVKKMKKAKKANQDSEAVTKVNSGPKPGKKSKMGKEKRSKEGDGTANENENKKEKVKKVLTKEQEEKVLARRVEKHSEWEKAIDSILTSKKVTKEEAQLLKKSKSYTRHPLWKKNYITWVKADVQYKDAKHGALIKNVYKILKGGERKAKRDKSKTKGAQHPTNTQAAIDRCVQLTSGQSKSPSTDTKPVEKKKGEKKVLGKKQEEGKGNKSEERKELVKPKKRGGKKKGKFGKMKQ